jgi:hypothetical protein
MTANKSLIEILYEQYQDEPGVRLFVEAISASTGFPIGVVVDTFVGTKVKKMQASRLRSFYDELNNGEIELNEELIENEDFLYSYFAVVNYVAISKSDEKAKRFARIIKGLYMQEINVDQFEYYTSIFNDLTETEFTILCIKYNYEKRPCEREAFINPYQKTSLYWEKFINDILNALKIDREELSAILIRLQRTGCFKLHIGYYDMKSDGSGDTTSIFRKIYDLVKE